MLTPWQAGFVCGMLAGLALAVCFGIAIWNFWRE